MNDLLSRMFLVVFGSLFLVLGCDPETGSRVPASHVADQTLEPGPDYTNNKARGWNEDGIDHLKREHWRKAAADFGRALELDPDFAEAHFNRALAFEAQGNRGEAERHFRLALQNAADASKMTEHPAFPENLKSPRN